MEDIIHKFGIDGKLIIIQIINFVVLVGLLSYFLYKPLLKMLAEREEKIAQGIKDAETAAEAKKTADEEKKTILSQAHEEAESIAARAQTHAKEKTASLTEEAQAKADHIVRDAHTKGEEIKAQAQKESEDEIAKLAVLAAEKVLRQKSS